MTADMPEKIMVAGEPEREIRVDVEPYDKTATSYTRFDLVAAKEQSSAQQLLLKDAEILTLRNAAVSLSEKIEKLQQVVVDLALGLSIALQQGYIKSDETWFKIQQIKNDNADTISEAQAAIKAGG